MDWLLFSIAGEEVASWAFIPPKFLVVYAWPWSGFLPRLYTLQALKEPQGNKQEITAQQSGKHYLLVSAQSLSKHA